MRRAVIAAKTLRAGVPLPYFSVKIIKETMMLASEYMTSIHGHAVCQIKDPTFIDCLNTVYRHKTDTIPFK